MTTINTAFGRRFVETVFVPKMAKDKDGNAYVSGFDRVPAIWNGMSQPVLDRAYYPGDPMSPASRKLTQQAVKEFADRETREQAKRNKKR